MVPPKIPLRLPAAGHWRSEVVRVGEEVGLRDVANEGTASVPVEAPLQVRYPAQDAMGGGDNLSAGAYEL
jgi:hypothetical protein